VKHALILALSVSAVCLTACTTLENRRDMYAPQKVDGPYTRMLREGIPSPDPTPVPVQGGSDFKSVR